MNMQFGLFYIVFAIVIGLILFTIIKGIAQWGYNNQQPVLTVPAKVTGKRENTTHHDNMVNDNMMHSSSTSYYATFEVESGDRMELHLSAREYGQLAENDYGRLTFQGTRYLGFERN
jgi:hypothetical protein